MTKGEITMNFNPDISVGIPCYNGAILLRRAIESVLNQTLLVKK